MGSAETPSDHDQEITKQQQVHQTFPWYDLKKIDPSQLKGTIEARREVFNKWTALMARLSWHESTAKSALEGLMDEVVGLALQADIESIGRLDLGLIHGRYLRIDTYNQAQKNLTACGFYRLIKENFGDPESTRIYVVFAKELTPGIRELGGGVRGW